MRGLEARYATGVLQRRWVHPFLGRLTITGTLLWSGLLNAAVDFFVEVALCGGEFKDEVRELTDSRAVVEAIAADRNAIGYAGIGFRAEGVKPLALASGRS